MPPPTSRKRAERPSPGASAKRPRTAVSVDTSRPQVRIKNDPDRPSPASGRGGPGSGSTAADLRSEFVQVFSDPAFSGGVPNSALKAKFGERYAKLPPIINEFNQRGRLTMSRVGGAGGELLYNLVSEEMASKFAGLDVSARMVYQVIEKAGNMGIWTKDVRTQTTFQTQQLNKIFKALEGRRLIKPVKAVTAKQQKRYMLFDLTPAKEITGGPWYTESEFDHEFIGELRTFIMHCVRRLNGGKGVTLSEISEKMKQANVSRVALNLEEVQQLMQTLAFDYMIEQSGVNQNGEAMFVAARKVTTMCEFKWWEVIDPDFHFRKIKFEDGVTLAAHEPHHHSQ